MMHCTIFNFLAQEGIVTVPVKLWILWDELRPLRTACFSFARFFLGLNEGCLRRSWWQEGLVTLGNRHLCYMQGSGSSSLISILLFAKEV